VRNPNVRILLIALALVAVVGVAGLFISRGQLAPMDEPDAVSGAAQAYLRVQVGDQVWEPIALTDGGEYAIDQPDGKQNVVHTTANGAVMHFSTCDNQNCVQQGEVTLDNRESRVLGSMIICLPNMVILEVLTPAEAGMEAAQ